MEDANKVVTDHNACTTIGDEVLKLGGNAVDAAVAATVCMAVVEPHVTGLVLTSFTIVQLLIDALFLVKAGSAKRT